MDKTILKAVLDYDFSNLNKIIDTSRKNCYAANNLKKKEMNVVKYYFLNKKPISKYPLKLIFTWHFKDKHRDLDNCVPKNILDALVNIGILKNDNLTCIREIQHKSIVDGNYYVELEIEEYEE